MYVKGQLVDKLYNEKDINLIPMKIDNSKKQYPKSFRQLIFKIRRRIETSFSQLSEQLNIAKVRAKYYWVFITWLRTKILEYNICYFINKCLGTEINISHIKSVIFG